MAMPIRAPEPPLSDGVVTLRPWGEEGDVEAAVREILNAVLRNDGKAFVVAHNHPSGDPTPSRAARSTSPRMLR
jgi:hypothetical protein